MNGHAVLVCVATLLLTPARPARPAIAPQSLGGKVMKCSWGRHPNTPPSGVQTSLMLAAAAGLNPLAMGSAGGLAAGCRAAAPAAAPRAAARR